MYELSYHDILVLSLGSVGLGVFLLAKGGNWTVDSSVFIAEKLGLSPLFIGFTIVAFGTSLPELLVSVNANLGGYPGVAAGNVIGSNIANVLFVLGAAGMIALIPGDRRKVWRDLCMMVLATAIFIALMQQEVILRWQGGAMVALLLAYVIYMLRHSRDIGVRADIEEPDFKSSKAAIFFLLLGLVGVSLGAEFLVRGATQLGRLMGVPEAVIGLTVVAFGTSLPEVATCISAAYKKHTDLMIGNVVGSNIFNILSIIGITALIKPLAVDPALTGFELWLMGGISLAFAVWMVTLQHIGRYSAMALTAGYLIFIGSQFRTLF